MKKLIIIAFLALSAFAYAAEGEEGLFAGVFPFEYERPESPDAAQLAAIHYVLMYATQNTNPVSKFSMDIMPWLKWGNTPTDPTSVRDRLYTYAQNMNKGVQTYIFKGSNEELPAIDFDSLSEGEKEVYYLHLQLLFNKDYKVQLNQTNMKRLQEDGDFYWSYFFQLMDMLGLPRK